jgi:CheY-like chemotaxis protein
MDEGNNRIRLLLVEDHPDCLEAFSIVLGEKYAVFGYPSPVEALRAIDVAKPDVLVLDVGMQPVDGLQCLKMVRARPGYSDVPAIALTGFAQDVERQRFLDSGFQAVVLKLADVEDLIAVIDTLVGSPAAPPRSASHPPRDRALPPRSAAAAYLDGRAPMTASGTGGPGETDGQGPA